MNKLIPLLNNRKLTAGQGEERLSNDNRVATERGETVNGRNILLESRREILEEMFGFVEK